MTMRDEEMKEEGGGGRIVLSKIRNLEFTQTPFF